MCLPPLQVSLSFLQRLTLGSIGELRYALGNVASKQVSFLGKAHVYESIEHYENALVHYQNAGANHTQSAAAIAETQYKLATQFIKIEDYASATYVSTSLDEFESHAHTLRSHLLDQATQHYGSKPVSDAHLARLLFQRSRIQTLTARPGAKKNLHDAFMIRLILRPNDKRSAEELTEADFDELVELWER